MTPMRFLSSLLLTLALMASAHAQFVPVPALSGRVVDQAGMLQATERSQLEAQLADYEAKTGSQIAILLVKTTEPEAIEQYSIRVVDAWKLGRKGIDDGVLLMVARDNPSALRRLRIEAGRGVQGSLTDAKSKQILQDVIAPYFRQNQFHAGLSAGVTAIAHLLDAEKFPAPPPVLQQQGQTSQDSGGIPWWMMIVGVFVLASIFRPRRRARLSSSGWGSGATGFILGNAIGSMTRGGGGFGGGGGGFGGGGFGGGGGGFDGGGASGDW